MKSLKVLAALFISVFGISAACAQTIKDTQAAEVTKKIDTKNYIFKAQYALPMRGGQKYLNYDYDLRITKDSIIGYLPYYGEVQFDPPVNTEDNPLKFISTNFDYKVTPKKKGGWTIKITPKDVKYISGMTLDVYDNGSSELLVNSNYRDLINFTGYIKGVTNN